MKRAASLSSFFVRVCQRTVVVSLLSVIVVAPARDVRAQALSDHAHSLKIVPADAAFYTASLRLKEQWDIFTGSNAYARLMQIPYIQGGKMFAEYQLQESPEPQIAMIREFMASPEGKEIVALVEEMFADEVFCYGSSDVADLIELGLELNSINQSAQMEAITSEQSQAEIMGRKMMEWLNQHKEELKLPDIVFGFRVRDKQRAERHVDILNEALNDALAAAPPDILARLRREQIAGHPFLTLRLDGSLLPWEEIRADATDLDADEFEQLKALISGKTVAIAIGVVDEFVVLSVGDSTEHLEKLGQGALLADGAAMTRLAKHAGQRLTSVSFASGEFISKANSPERSMNDAVDMMVEALKQAPIDEEQQIKLGEDMRGFAKAMVKYLPQPGELSAISYLTPRGVESFRYSLGNIPGADASRPLTVLNHVGGSPLLFIASHAGDTVEDYDLAITWLSRLAIDVEKIAEQQTPPAEWAKYQQHRERGLALLRRIDRANREQLIPALAANEQAFVMDVASKSVQWIAPMPRSPVPLPIFEIGVVSRVSDAALLRSGVSEYATVIQDALNLAHEISPDEIPQLQLPAPEVRRFSDGTLYSYQFPAEWGVDSQMALNAGLTEQAVAVSLLPAYTEQLLKPVPLAIDTSLDLNRPAAIVTHFQFAKLIDAVRPWIDYGFAVATGALSADPTAEVDDEAQQAMMLQAGLIMPQVYQTLEVLKALHSQTSITYREEDIWVTHAEMRLKDLE